MLQKIIHLTLFLLLAVMGVLLWNTGYIPTTQPHSSVDLLSTSSPSMVRSVGTTTIVKDPAVNARPASTTNKVSPQTKVTTQVDAPPKIVVSTVTPGVQETPGPLVIDSQTTQTTAPPPSTGEHSVVAPSENGLTPLGILAIVNTERSALGLAPLQLNSTLRVIAEVKTADMIALQYFAHSAPDGTDIGILASRYQYEYLRVGENLAMGDFTSDADVMTGWMNSPGHRANILNPEYTEIGIAALQGMHDGRMMWYAVQEFGRPAALCPKPDALLAKKIVIYEQQLKTLEQTLTTLRTEIETGAGDREELNAKIKDYNTIVDLYNKLIALTKEAVGVYNDQVATYNTCIGT